MKKRLVTSFLLACWAYHPASAQVVPQHQTGADKPTMQPTDGAALEQQSTSNATTRPRRYPAVAFTSRTGEEYRIEGLGTQLEQMPELPGGGGIDAVATAVQKAVRYPRQAQADGVQGQISVSFVVTPQGEVTDVTIVRGIEGFDEEVIRAVRTLPAFVPGKYGGQPVSAVLTIPVTFKIQ